MQFQLDGTNAGSPAPLSTAGGVTTASFSTTTLAVGTHTLSAVVRDVSGAEAGAGRAVKACKK